MAVTWVFGRLTALDIAWILWSLANSLDTKPCAISRSAPALGPDRGAAPLRPDPPLTAAVGTQSAHSRHHPHLVSATALVSNPVRRPGELRNAPTIRADRTIRPNLTVNRHLVEFAGNMTKGAATRPKQATIIT